MTAEWTCVCDNEHCPDNGYCETYGACYSFVTNAGKDANRGCLDRGSAQMQCDSIKSTEAVISCCYEQLCNHEINITLPTHVETPILTEGEASSLTVVGSISGGIVVFALMVYGIVRTLRVFKQKMSYGRCDSTEHIDGTSHEEQANTTTSAVEDTSGSGKGYTALIRRTIAKELIYVGTSPIGKGRYGEVWRGQFKGRDVAIKQFPSTEGESFYRESDIYDSLMLRHPNILDFIASDLISSYMQDDGTKLLLITAYHRYGSLYEFLQVEQIDRQLAVRLLSSVLSGLTHLHCGIVGSVAFEGQNSQNSYKVAIAHRDIKSRNILVKDDLTCCIADFGLAVKQTPDGQIDFGHRTKTEPNPRVGTRRYMAPEVLNQSINMNDFGAFQRADVYAVGLLLWEVTNVICDEKVECLVSPVEYQPPYYYLVSADPQFEEMEELICAKKMRPFQKEGWETCEVMKILSMLQRECWSTNSKARLPMLRIKKSLSQCEKALREEYKQCGRNYDQQIEKMKVNFERNYHERIKQKEAEERRREELRTEEIRLIQQQYFHHASPIPHNYFSSHQWAQNQAMYTSTPLTQFPQGQQYSNFTNFHQFR